MMKDLEREDIHAAFQSEIKVVYEGEVIGEYFADIHVDNKMIVENKNGKEFVNLE